MTSIFDTRNVEIIEEEISDLQAYLQEIPNSIIETGAFDAYKLRLSDLNQELFLSQLYVKDGNIFESFPDFSESITEEQQSLLNQITVESDANQREEIAASLKKSLSIKQLVTLLGLAAAVASHFGKSFTTNSKP
jgi:hypothetical protein